MATYSTILNSYIPRRSELSNSGMYIFDMDDFNYEFSWESLLHGIDSIKKFGYEIILVSTRIDPFIKKFMMKKFIGNKFKLGGSKK